MSNPLKAAAHCCATDPLRPQMHQPFHQEGWNLATDAHVIFGWQGEPVTTGHERSPNAIGFILNLEQELPQPFVVNLGGLGTVLDSLPKVAGPCPACNASKTCKCQECEHEHDCGHCKGTGFDPHGKADLPDPNAIVQLYGHARFVAKKMNQLRAVMNALETRTCTITHGTVARANLVAFPNGERMIIMPNMVGDADEVKATLNNGQL